MSFLVVDKPRPHIALVTLNRPERMNAMAFDVMIPFRQALEEINRDNDVRVIVVTGAGHGFCSGADLTDSGRVPNIDGLTIPTVSLRAMELLDDVILTIRKLHQPVIGAINGAAIGGGFCLALAFDIRVASESAYFRAAGINNGLSSTELGLSYLLPRYRGVSGLRDHAHRARRGRARGRTDRFGVNDDPGRGAPRHLLRHGRADHRLEPGRGRDGQAGALVGPRCFESGSAHASRRRGSAVRAQLDRQLRGDDPGPA